MLFLSCVMLSRADLLAIICDLIVSLSLSHWYPGSRWYLIVSIPDIYPLSYFCWTWICQHLFDKNLLLYAK